MASSRELWIVLRGRDEASRTVNMFSKNVRSAGLAVKAAQLQAQAASMRQRAEALKSSSVMAQQIRDINAQVRGREEEARQFTLAAAKAREYRDSILKVNGTTNEQIRLVNNIIRAHMRGAASLNAEAGVLRSSARSVAVELDKQVRALNDNAIALEQQANKMKQSSIDAKLHERRLRDLSGSMMAVSQTATAMGVAFGVAGVAGLIMLKDTVDVAVEYDRQVRRTFTQVDNVKTSLKELGEIGLRVAGEVGTPFETLQDTLFFIFSSMDVTIKESEIALRSFAKEAVAGQTDIESAARTSIAIINTLGYSVADLTKLQDIQFQVVRKGIISYEELSNTIGRALPATKRAGQEFETLGAMIAFLTRNGLSAAMSATSAARALEAFAHPKTVARMEKMGVAVRDQHGAFRPLVDVIRDLKKQIKGGANLKELFNIDKAEAESFLGSAAKKLANFGVAVKDSAGNFRDIDSVLKEVDRVMGQIAAPERAKFMQELFLGAGGTIQARRFWDVALTNFDQFEEMVKHMKNSSGVFQSAYETMANAVATKSELLRNKWMILKETIGNALMPVLLVLIGLLSKALDWFNNLPDGVKNTISIVFGLASVLSLLVGAFLLVVGIISFFIAGVVAAGTALLVVAGILAVVGAAFTAFMAVLILAWNKSEGFRNIIHGLGKTMKALYTEFILPTALGIKDAWEQHMVPPLNKLWALIDKKILPKFKEFTDFLSGEVVADAKELGKEIVENVGKAFEAIGKIIENDVIPAFEQLTTWYKDNEDEIKKLSAVLIDFGKAVLGSAVLGFILSVVAGFKTMATVVGFLISVFVNTFQFFKELFNDIGDFFTNMQSKSEEAGDGLVSIWESVKGFFIGIIDGIVNTVLGIWERFWGTFGELIKAGWELMQEIWKLGTNILIIIVSAVVGWVVDKWNKFWGELKKLASDFWGWIGPIIKSRVEDIKKWWNTLWGGIKSFFSDIWDGIKKIVTDKFGGVWEDIKDIGGKIKGFFDDAKDWLYQAGKDLIDGLIEGITKRIKDLTDKLRKINKIIEDNKGPREYDLRMLRPAGQNIMIGLMRGINDLIPQVKAAMQDVGTMVTAQIELPRMSNFETASTQASIIPSMSQPTQRTINQEINIYTHEIDPRATAAELGWELMGRSD